MMFDPKTGRKVSGGRGEKEKQMSDIQKGSKL